MTLNISIYMPGGVIQSSDNRLIWNGSMRNITSANKHIVLTTYDGFMFITYCGIGAFSLGDHKWKMDEWITQVLFSPPKLRDIKPGQPGLEVQTVREAIKTIEEEATSQLGKLFANLPIGGHWFSVAGESFDKRFIGFITNMNPNAQVTDQPNNRFKAYLDELPDMVDAAIYVPRNAVNPKDAERLNRIIKTKDVSMKDVDHFLASVHHNAATDGENKKWVSSSCTTTYTDDTAARLGFRGTYHKITRGSTNNISIEPKVLTWDVPNEMWSDIWHDAP